MNEEAIRALVREVIARQLSTGAAAQGHSSGGPGPVPLAWHASHARYPVMSGEEVDGPCLIEPAVRCNHCGYCQSHGY